MKGLPSQVDSFDVSKHGALSTFPFSRFIWAVGSLVSVDITWIYVVSM